MYKITVKIPNRKGPNEVIFGCFWLAYHSLHSLYGVKDNQIDEAFKTSEKEPCLIDANGKTFIVEQVEMSPQQIHNEIDLSQSILQSVISEAEDEGKVYVNMACDFLTRLYNVLHKINKSI
jgi:hypothetical protein